MKKMLSLFTALFTVVCVAVTIAIPTYAANTVPDWFNAKYYAATYPDVVAVYGTKPESLFLHYQTYGQFEGRSVDGEYIEVVTTPPVIPGICKIVVNRTTNTCNVYSTDLNGEDTLVRSMVCTTGRPGHRTPLGSFTIYEHTDGGGMHPMKGGVYARYCMRFKQGGYMFHSICYKRKSDTEPMASHVSQLGTNASSGCIRLSVEDAEWMYTYIPDGTSVTVVE